jgi:hypothetical protein
MNKGRVVMALEQPFANLLREKTTSLLELNWNIIAVDAAVELAVAMINNNTEVLPDHIVEIARVNNLDPNPTVSLDNSGGYALNQVYEFLSNVSDSDLIIAQGNPEIITLSSGRLWSYYNISYCGYEQTSLEYLNPQYSGFFNFLPRYQYKNGFLPLLKSFNASRVAVIHGNSKGSLSNKGKGAYFFLMSFNKHPVDFKDGWGLKTELMKAGIEVAVTSAVSYRFTNEFDKRNLYQLLLNNNVRFVYILEN